MKLLALIGLAHLALASLARGSDSRTKLNGPLVSTATVGDVQSMLQSPDGLWVAYLADQDTAGRRELYAVRRDGTAGPSKLSGPLVAGGAIHRFSFTPDGARVLYHADQDVNDVDELYSAPVDGSAAAVKLNGPLVAGGDVYWTGLPWPLTSDGQVVVYTADEDTNDRYQLYSVPTAGGAAPTPLFLSAPASSVSLTRLASDDSTVVFTGTVPGSGNGLFKVPIDGSAAPVLVNGVVTPGTFIADFDVAPDASRVVYIGDRSLTGKNELFSRPLDLSSAAVVLNGPLQAQGDVYLFRISGTSQRVVYDADQDSDEDRELYSVPLDGSVPAVKLNDPITVGVFLYSLSDDGSRVVYLYMSGSAHTLRSVPIDRSSSPVVLSSGTSGFGTWRITPDSTRVLLTRQGGLYSIPVDGSGPLTLLSPPTVGFSWVGAFAIAADSALAVYGLGASSGAARELFSVPVDGSAAPTLLTPAGASWGQLEGDFQVDAVSGTAVFRGDTEVLGVTELLTVPLDASALPVVLNDPLPTGNVTGEVTSFAVSPDGQWAVYADAQGFHGAPIVRRGPARLLTPPGLSAGNGVGVAFWPEVAFTPDSKQVFLSLATERDVFLYRAPVDASAPATLVHAQGSGIPGSGDRFSGFRFTPDGATLVYSRFVFNYFGPPNYGSLYAVPVDGSAAPRLLASGYSLLARFVSGDGTRVAFAQQGDDFGGATLSSVPVDGSASPVSLLPGALSFYDGLYLAADGATVVYRAIDLFLPSSQGLFSSPIDASVAPTLLASGTVPLHRVNSVTPHVAYVVNGASARELRHGPVDGSSAAVLLASLPPSVTVQDLVFSPDGSRIVYRADAGVANQFELYSVPTDASQAPVKVNGPVVSGGDVTAGSSGAAPHFAVTPDGTRVVYRADARVNDVLELWSAPIGGGGPATMLHNPFTPGLGVSADFRVLANSRDILLLGNSAFGVLPLWQARVDQTGPFKLRSGPFPHAAVVEEGFQVTAGERHVVYRSDHETAGVTELYAFPLQRVQHRTR